MGVHAKLSPSASGRWMTCTGSLKLAEGIKRRPSASLAADEGTAAHELLEHCLNNNLIPHDVEIDFITVGKNKFPVDLDMRNAVGLAYDWVQGYLFVNPSAKLTCELRVDPGIWFLREDCFGTSDVVIETPSISELVVGDYKHGKGITVDVEHNTQMLIYMLGVALPHFEYKSYRLVILQPRARHKDGPIREWVITRDELRAFEAELETVFTLVDEINAGIERPEEHLAVSDKACQFCDVQPICPELATHNLSIMRNEFQDFDDVNLEVEVYPVRAVTLNSEQLAWILDNAKLIQKWLKGVEEYCFLQLERGHAIGDYKLVRKRSNRVWGPNEEAVYTKLRKLGFKVSDIQTKKLATPPAVEKIVKGLKDKELSKSFYELVEKPDGGLTMAAGDDPRKAVSPENVPADDFAEDHVDE